jgi:hypothetical protein
MQLFRPMNIHELESVYDSAMSRFPPRLEGQPFFYPVITLEYACEIAERWNAREESGAGYVCKFAVDDTYVSKFPAHQVGNRSHRELWIPADEPEAFNDHVVPPILVVATYFGPQFRGYIPRRFGLKDKDAATQFTVLAATLDYSAMDVHCEVLANNKAVFLNFAYWEQFGSSLGGITDASRDALLAYIRATWSSAFSNIPLPMT